MRSPIRLTSLLSLTLLAGLVGPACDIVVKPGVTGGDQDSEGDSEGQPVCDPNQNMDPNCWDGVCDPNNPDNDPDCWMQPPPDDDCMVNPMAPNCQPPCPDNDPNCPDNVCDPMNPQDPDCQFMQCNVDADCPPAQMCLMGQCQ